MAISYGKLWQPLELGTVATAIYTVPENPTTNILINGRVKAVNNTSTAATVTIYAVPASATDSATNIFTNAVSISGNDSLEIDLPWLSVGDAIWALGGTANAITLHFMNGVIRS